MKRVATPQEPDSQANPDEDADTLVWGALAIGAVIKRKPRQVFHLAATGAIPVHRVGGRLCARKSKLLAIAG